MTELIDPKALKEYIDDCKYCDNCPKKGMRCVEDCELPDFLTAQWERIIDEQPIIEAEPVIHCKDCKHYRYVTGYIDGLCGRAEWYKRYQREDDYCSRAERKEE